MAKLDLNEYEVANYDEKGAAVVSVRRTMDRKQANSWAAETRYSAIVALDYQGQVRWEVIN